MKLFGKLKEKFTYQFNDFPERIQTMIIRKFLIVIIFIIFSIANSFLTKNLKLFLVTLVPIILYASIVFRTYCQFACDKVFVLVGESLGSEKIRNGHFFYVETKDIIYRIGCNRKKINKGTRVKVYMTKEDIIVSHEDNTFLVNNPILIEIEKIAIPT